MARFYLHLHNGIGYVRDEDGQDLAELSQARDLAIVSIRDIIGAEAKKGRIDLRGRIEITDDAGKVLAVVPFSEALTVLTGQAPP